MTLDASPHDGLPDTRRRWAAAAIFMTLALTALDTAIANIALPAIAADLSVSAADAVWVVNVYQIAMVATLLPLAALGEIAGHERVYLGGLILFTLASVGCALAASLTTLLIARTLQGLGASAAMAVNTALVRFVYPARFAGRGFAHNALVVGSAITLGPTIASGILYFGSWPWLFAINLPLGIISLLIGLKTLPRTTRATHGFDLPMAALSTAALGFLISGLGSAAHHASFGIVVAQVAIGLVFGTLLLRRQAGHPAPMLPVDLFRLPMFTLSAMTAICSFTTQGLAFVALPFYFEDILKRSQSETGLLMTPWPLVVAIMAPVAGRLLDRHKPGLLGGVGLALLGIGMALLAALPPDASVANIVWRMALCGCGFGFFQAPNMTALMGAAPAGRAGGASGIVATARLTGQTTGAALAAFCFGLFGKEGATVALALGAGFSMVGCAMSLLRLAISQRI